MMEQQVNGLILKGVGSFYYVEAEGTVYECRARGAFRQQKITPLAGDRVTITLRENRENTVDAISERKNFLQRPPVANVDTLVIVSSITEPTPSTLVIDKLTAIAVNKNIRPCVVFTKPDLADTTELEALYRRAGLQACSVCATTGEGIEAVRDMLGGLTVFTGNTGVGKSSLLNCLDPQLARKTGEISQKLGRGRHTTREVTLYRVGDGYVADTPGFSSIDLEQANDVILKDYLAFCFPEFVPYLGTCKFSTCSHTVEKGCKILEALQEGKIEPSRHRSYVTLYNEVKNLKEWEL